VLTERPSRHPVRTFPAGPLAGRPGDRLHRRYRPVESRVTRWITELGAGCGRADLAGSGHCAINVAPACAPVGVVRHARPPRSGASICATAPPSPVCWAPRSSRVIRRGAPLVAQLRRMSPASSRRVGDRSLHVHLSRKCTPHAGRGQVHGQRVDRGEPAGELGSRLERDGVGRAGRVRNSPRVRRCPSP